MLSAQEAGARGRRSSRVGPHLGVGQLQLAHGHVCIHVHDRERGDGQLPKRQLASLWREVDRALQQAAIR